MLASGLCFVAVNFFVKILGAGGEQDIIESVQRYPAHELVLARSIVSFAISLFIIKRKKIPVFGVNKKWLLIRGLAGTIALTMFFYTIHHLPIALATIIQYLAPIFTVILAMILLKEKVKAIQWFFIIWDFTWPQGIEWFLLLIIGIFTQLAQISLTKALHLGSAATITPFQYLGAIYMFLTGYFVFDERLSFIVNVGIAIILSGVLLNAVVKGRKRVSG